MPKTLELAVLPDTDQETGTKTEEVFDPGFLVVCWDDPVNLMEYVTHVLMKVFGWNRAKAEKHMLEVHNSGKSVLAREGRERAEHYVHELQRHHLHASLEKAD